MQVGQERGHGVFGAFWVAGRLPLGCVLDARFWGDVEGNVRVLPCPSG